MTAGLPTVRIGRIRWRTPARELGRVYGCVRSNLSLGEHTRCRGFVTEPREGLKKTYGKNAAVRIRSIRWPQDCQK